MKVVMLSKKERIGVVGILVLATIGLTFPLIYRTYFEQPPNYEIHELVVNTDSIANNKKHHDYKPHQKQKKKPYKEKANNYPTKDKNKTYKPWPKKPKVIKPIHINTVTAEELQAIRGIGPTFSKRIISYRDLLGGFTNLKQLHEVYHLPDSTIQNAQPHLIFDEKHLNRIHLHSTNYKTLVRHPYIRKAWAGKLLNQKGKIFNVEQLNNKFPDDVKFKPYIQLDSIVE